MPSLPQVSAVIVVTLFLTSLTSYTRRPVNLRPVGGRWYAVASSNPGSSDSITYRLFYKFGPRYQAVDDLVAEHRFVPPDCVSYRGLKVVGHPLRAMCGHRVPFESYDTTLTEAELLDKARSQPALVLSRSRIRG